MKTDLLVVLCSYCYLGTVMASALENITLSEFKWLNEPQQWTVANNTLRVVTENNTDFWQGTYYGFHRNTGHCFGANVKDDFTLSACIEANFTTLYDQAGLMIYIDEQHWLKAGIEFNDGQPMIGSVLTNGESDWATGVFNGNPKKFWLRLSKVGSVVIVKYSTDNKEWLLLRLCPFSVADTYLVGPMTCSPERKGLEVTFSAITFEKPANDILHSN